MVVVACPAPGCTYRTDDLPPEIIAPLLSIHAQEHTRPSVPASKGPKLNRPVIDVGVNEETWNAFIRRWETFRRGSDIGEDSAPLQLFQCASESLGDLLLKSDPTITARSTKDVLTAMRSIAVIPVARGVSRAELAQMSQSSDEPIRTFAARVRGKAETCEFTTTATCECGKTITVDYTSETVRDVILAGINDNDIRREALSARNLQTEPVNNVVSFIEGKEMARNATPVTSVSTMSSYKRDKQPKPDPVKTYPCPECGKPYQRYRQKPGGSTNKLPYKQCIECFRANKQKQPVNRGQTDKTTSRSHLRAIQSEFDHISQISALGAKAHDHPTALICIGFDGQTETQWAAVKAIADTGAQSNVWGLDDFLKAGFLVKDLQPSTLKIRAANAVQMNLVGQFRGMFKGQSPSGDEITCKGMVFVSDSVKGFYLS